MMKSFIIAFINYILDGFGFTDITDFKMSAFCFMKSKAIINIAVSSGVVISVYAERFFGVSLSFLIAYFVLIAFEWLSGILASAKRGEKHNSRKLGRMLFKIAVYSVPLYIFNLFKREVHFPSIRGYEIDPFNWLYWTVILVIIWQLFVSVLENLEHLNIRYAKVLLKIINRKFYKNFEIEEDNTEKNNKHKL